jgi:hypothetical protein
MEPKATTSGFASTFSTTLDYVEKPDGKRKGRGRGKNSTKTSETNNDGKKKEKKCFICDDPGYFANKCPKMKDKRNKSQTQRTANLKRAWACNMGCQHICRLP